VRLQAVVFDFDGLIIDSEWSIFEMAAAAFAEHGHDLTVEAWATIVGTNDSDHGWWDTVCAAAGITGFSQAEFEAAYARQPRTYDDLPPLPGVLQLLDELEIVGVPAGIASSSGTAWLHRHTRRLGIEDRFAAIVGSDQVGGVGKPAPDVYLKACADLGVEPAAAVALEDSAHGASAAKAAGMTVVAVPGPITRSNDFSHVDLVVRSVAEVNVSILRSLLG